MIGTPLMEGNCLYFFNKQNNAIIHEILQR